MGYTRTAIAVAVAVVAAAPVLAQNTTANIGGRVLAADGSPVSGAQVTVLHVESGSSNTATTDAQGRYGLRGLRVGGPFTITFSKGGLTDKREDVFLALAETAALDGRLGVAAQSIVITGRGVNDKFNSSNMGAGTNITSRELNTFASIQRNLQDYARTDPRLAQTDKDRGEISAVGQNTRFNSITIDGVTTNDTFGLEANNLPTIKQPISIDAIASVQVNLSNYDVTQKGYTGANINAVTKSGTNEFKGSLYYVFRDDGLVGKRFNRTDGTYFDAPSFNEDTIGFTIGGPIIKDKLFFFGVYEEFKSSRGSPDFGPLGSSSTNVGITQSAIDQAISTARTTWNMDVGSPAVPQGLEVVVKDVLLKLDWNISDNHRANLRYTKTEQGEPNIAGFSGTSLSLSSWWWNQDKTVESLVGQWFADWTPNLSTELKVSSRDFASRPTQVNGTRLPAIGLRFSGALPPGTPAGVNSNPRVLNFGTELSRQFNELETKTTDIYAGATWNLGNHELKFGIDYAENDVFNAFLQNVNGNYTFACEPGTYSFGTFTSCNDMTSAQRDLAVLENFRAGTPSAYTLQSPRGDRTLQDGVARWSYTNTGLFLQDSFRVSDKLSVMLGLRMDQQGVPTPPLANAAVAAPLVAGSMATPSFTRNSGGFGVDNTTTLDGNRLFQPRAGFNWNLGTNERRMQLRGGFGLFQGAAANVWLSNPFSNTGVAVAQLNCVSFSACRAAGVTFRADPDNQPRLTGQPPSPNVDIISPDLEQPSVWKANLAFETEVPGFRGVIASAEWLHTKVDSAIYYQNLNLGAATRVGPDGRNLYYRPEGYNPACFNPATGGALTTGACANPSGQSRVRALSNQNFNNVLLATRTTQGHGDAITLGLSRASTSGLGWSLYYTKTSAKEVSPLTSATSGSNYSNRQIFNQNEEALQNSNYLIKDRFSGSLSWSKAFVANYRTSVGVFYEGRRGKPYTWTYINDLNGDGVGGNDLMYIPSAPGSGEVVFRGNSSTQTAAQAEAAFWAVVNGNTELSNARGGLVGRNTSFAPWVNNFDVRFSQELPGFTKQHKATVVLDILNFGNLLNKRWGRIDEIGFPSNRSFVNYGGIENGRYVYTVGSTEDFITRQSSGESQWAVQATLRYEF
jgi:hypothetical protein